MSDHEGDHDLHEVAELNQQFDALDDPRDCYRLVQERIRQYQLDGSDVPEDLAVLERQLMTECMAESQGR